MQVLFYVFYALGISCFPKFLAVNPGLSLWLRQKLVCLNEVFRLLSPVAISKRNESHMRAVSRGRRREVIWKRGGSGGTSEKGEAKRYIALGN